MSKIEPTINIRMILSVMDGHSFVCGAAILIACFIPVLCNFSCDECPVVPVGSECTCYVPSDGACGISCHDGKSAEFPSFQPIAADLNITYITIAYYQIKEIPSYAFNMGSNVTVKQIRLTSIPTLEKIQAHAFSRLTSLEKLKLEYVANLHTFDPTCFSGLYLSQLEIDYGGLTELPTDSLKQIWGLRRIKINSNNNISSLRNGTFVGMSSPLDYLDLTYNTISNISANAFIGLPNLTTLDLRHNSITRIQGPTFAGLQSLSNLLLEDNPITTIDAHAFNGTDLPKLLSLSLSVSNATVIDPDAFDTLPELKEIIIRLPADDFSQGNCMESISISCEHFPKLEHLDLCGAVCADILKPLSTCIKSLSISSNDYQSTTTTWSKPVCLSQLKNLENLETLSLKRLLYFVISFDLMGLKSLNSFYEPQLVSGVQKPTICDEALASTPYLTSLSLQKRDYIPKAVEKMENLVNLTLSYSTEIICNCSIYWLYNFTTSRGIDTSHWACNYRSKYGTVKNFLEQMHASGVCQNVSEPDFQEWDQESCSKLCPTDETTVTATSSTIPMQNSTSPSSGTSSSAQKAEHSNETILYSVLGTLAFVFLLSSAVGYYWYKRFRRLRRVKVEQLALQSHGEASDHWEVSRSFLHLFEEKLGSGAFGVVVKGKLLAEPPAAVGSSLNVIRESAEMEGIVAVKMLPSHANSDAKYQFLQEIETMKSLGQHPHLVSIIACITTSEPVCLIVDYCSDGDLLKFLKARKPSSENPELKAPSLKDQLSFAWQVADGMSFLSSKGYTHRDLAARNVLIHNSNMVKVSDFGLCRLTDEDTASYVTRGGRLPLRWLAPECIQDYKFTIASDVWAFGILLVEIINLGSTPYEGMHLSEIESFLAQGKRIGQMEGCPDNLYQMMLHCWEEVPEDRPGFPELRDELVEMLEKEAHESYDYLTLIPETSGLSEK